MNKPYKITGAKMRRPSKALSPPGAVGVGILGGVEAVTDAPAPGLNSPTARAGLSAPASNSVDKL